MLRLLCDENFNADIVRGLLLLRPGLDIVRTQDTGLAGVSDPALLSWAAENDRILLTHDSATMPAHAWPRVAAGQTMPGLFVVSARCPVGRAIQELLLIDDCSEQREWSGRIFYLPL